MHDLYINIIYIKLILKKENNIKLKYNWKETWLEIGVHWKKKKKQLDYSTITRWYCSAIRI